MNTMTQSVRDFLEQPWPEPVLVVAACQGDEAPMTKAVSPEIASHVTAEFWTTLHDALTHLSAHQCAEAQSTWVFELTLLFVARREDGDWLALVTSRDIAPSARKFVQERLLEFAAAAS
jgi:hypothetical protein